MIDLTQAVEAAARAAYEQEIAARDLYHRPAWEELNPISRHHLCEALLPVVQAASVEILRCAAEHLRAETPAISSTSAQMAWLDAADTLERMAE